MKKFSIIALTLVLIAGLMTGCTKKKPETTTVPTTTAAPTQTKPVPTTTATEPFTDMTDGLMDPTNDGTNETPGDDGIVGEDTVNDTGASTEDTTAAPRFRKPY